MTPREFYEQLQTVMTGEKQAVMKLSMDGGGLSFKVSEHDAMAAKLLLWLEDQMPDASYWDLFEVLDAAHWWASFWTSLLDGDDGADVMPPPADCHNTEMGV